VSFDDNRRSLTLFPVLLKAAVVFTVRRWQIGQYVVPKLNTKSGTAIEFVYAVSAIFLLPVSVYALLLSLFGRPFVKRFALCHQTAR